MTTGDLRHEAASADVARDDGWHVGPLEIIRVILVTAGLGALAVTIGLTDASIQGVPPVSAALVLASAVLLVVAVLLHGLDAERHGGPVGWCLLGAQVAAISATMMPFPFLALVIALPLAVRALVRRGWREPPTRSAHLWALAGAVLVLLWLPAILAAGAHVCTEFAPRTLPGTGCLSPGKGVDMWRSLVGLVSASLGLLGLGLLLSVWFRVVGRRLVQASTVLAVAASALSFLFLWGVDLPYSWAL